MEKNGERKIIIDIKAPPLFAGARLTLTESDTQPKGKPRQFDLKFENLSSNAQNLLESRRESLNNKLIEKGYALHTISLHVAESNYSRTSNPTDDSDKDQSGDRGRGQSGDRGQENDEQKQRKH